MEPSLDENRTGVGAGHPAAEPLQSAYRIIRVVLRFQLIAAASVMAIGLLLVAAGRGGPGRPLVWLELPSMLLRGDGVAWTYAGIFLLLLVPVSNLVLALKAFVGRREYPFAIVTAIVLILLALSARIT